MTTTAGAAIASLPEETRQVVTRGNDLSKADRLAELLKRYSWNEAIRQLKADGEKNERN